MKKILETERLILREVNLDDYQFIISLMNSPGWLAYIGDRNVKNKEQAHKYLSSGPMASYTKNGFGSSIVLLKSTGKPIGMCGLIKRENLPHVDLGFAFLPEYGGKGYAFEMAKATLEYGKKRFGLKKIVAIVLPENQSSIKLLEKLGMKFERIIEFGEHKEELMLYSN